MADTQTTKTINEDEQTNPNLNDLFCSAVEEGDLKKAEQLLEQGADPDIQNNNQQTAEDLYCKSANNPIYLYQIAQRDGSLSYSRYAWRRLISSVRERGFTIRRV